jgi:transcriptional regulator with XRE-family HTH domain
MTQRQVAERLGVREQQVHKMEKGINRVAEAKLLAIARIFHVPVACLFDGYDRGAPHEPLVGPKTSRMLLTMTHAFRMRPVNTAVAVREGMDGQAAGSC